MSERPDGPDHVASLQPGRRPAVLLFDVNETLSDLAPMAGRFEDVGAPGRLAGTWFAGLLRDGFALTVAGAAKPFKQIGEELLRTSLHGLPLSVGVEEAVAHVLRGFDELGVHDDVRPGIEALHGLGIRLVTLSNGSVSVAERLLIDAGLRDRFERLLSVEDAGTWKPGRSAYAYALHQCGVAAHEAMLVAVHPWDIDGASRAGTGSAWINRGGAPYPGHFTRADVEAGSLVDLADQLR
jgi:2-haloacid dehalogenase